MSQTEGTAERFGYLNGDPRGLSHPAVYALLVGRDGRIWVGTGHGLDLLDPRSGRLDHFRQESDGRGLAGNLVRAIWEGPDGTIWVGSHGGLNRIAVAADGSARLSEPLLAPQTFTA
jgi:ligand-binding sensor domain-containing protein